VLQQMNVLPYRAGYEDHDRRQIQDRLVEGTLNGVVSTSALELGIDIPHLDICVLIGVPASATSLQQRIGRIGRHSPGSVIVVNGGDVHDEAVFSHPRSFFQRPLAESTLYLENEHIQYIHTLCLARANGEHDQVAQAAGKGRAEFSSPVDWPENFIRLCLKERAGEVPRRLASLKLEGRERPNYTFPLRDVESQFKVERRDGPNVSSMGSMSFAQMMREAYPGAIYYYATIPYRVTRVNIKAKLIQVRREKRYTTQAQRTLPAVFPRLSPGGVFSAGRQDGLLILETSLLVRESIRGVIEQRGRNESAYPYPLARELGYFQDQPYFSRNYFTTGVVLTHPALSVEGVSIEEVAAILYEAFMLLIPFERQDIGFAADHFRVDREPVIRQSAPFLTIYDQTYGSLRLTSRLLDPTTLGQVLVEAALLAGKQPALAHSPASIAALVEMARAVFLEGYEPLSFGAESEIIKRDPDRWERIVMPGSKGLMVRTNEEFHVMRVVKTPAGLSYEGTPDSMVGTGASVMPLLTDVAEVPGESVVGWYAVDTGTIEPAEALESAQVRVSGEVRPAGKAEVVWLRHALSVYFAEDLLPKVAEQTGGGAGMERAEMIEALLARRPAKDLLDAMLSVYLDEVKSRAEDAAA
jgi:DEAD/DEAH box helicase domain-containing protein